MHLEVYIIIARKNKFIYLIKKLKYNCSQLRNNNYLFSLLGTGMTIVYSKDEASRSCEFDKHKRFFLSATKQGFIE